MIPFIIVATAMTAIALAWVIVPLVRHQRGTAIAREASNVAILRDQLQELDRDLATGALTPAQHDEARRELEARVLDESRPQQAAPSAPTRSGRRTLWAIAAVVPVTAIALYAWWGNFDAFSPLAQVQDGHDLNKEQVTDMVARLAKRLEKEPDNADGWMVLARSYYALKRYPDAVRAFEHVNQLVPDQPAVLVDYADALAATQHSLEGKPMELVMQALKIEPTNWKALALAGTAAFDRRDYMQAVVYWQQLKQVVPPDSEMSKSVEASIAEARQLGGMKAADLPAQTRAASATRTETMPAAPKAAASTSALAGAPASANKVDGTVALSPTLASKASPDDVVFIFARPAEGSRMPLAIIRRQVKDLPAKFLLDDSTAMSPNMTLSSVPQIVVGARVSKSGTAMPNAGDLEGYSQPVKAGATGLNVVIDRVLQ